MELLWFLLLLHLILFFFLSLLFWLINLCEDSEIVIMAQYKSHRN